MNKLIKALSVAALCGIALSGCSPTSGEKVEPTVEPSISQPTTPTPTSTPDAGEAKLPELDDEFITVFCSVAVRGVVEEGDSEAAHAYAKKIREGEGDASMNDLLARTYDIWADDFQISYDELQGKLLPQTQEDINNSCTVPTL